MKALSTVLIAGVDAPKTSVSMRVQITSKTSPEAPERKKHKNGTASAARPEVAVDAGGGGDEGFFTGRGLYQTPCTCRVFRAF
jgi:hypothetical protein